MTSIHLIVSEDEKQSLVNALAFYNEYHTADLVLDDDSLEQWRMAFKGDNRNGWEWEGPIDKLATRIANCT